MNSQEIEEISGQLSKPVKWHIPDFIKTEHATHLVVQQQGSEFILLFLNCKCLFFQGQKRNSLKLIKSYLITKPNVLLKLF